MGGEGVNDVKVINSVDNIHVMIVCLSVCTLCVHCGNYENNTHSVYIIFSNYLELIFTEAPGSTPNPGYRG